MPPPKPPRRSRRPSPLIAAAIIASSASSLTPGADTLPDATGAPPAPPPSPTSGASSRQDDLSLLLSASAPDPARLEAARRLVLLNDTATVASLRDALRATAPPTDAAAPVPPSTVAAARRAVALAIAAVDPGSPRFSSALREGLLVASTPEGANAILIALDTYPARIATEAAVARLVAGDAPEAVSREIGAWLRAWTGCDECARSGPAGWVEWWARAKGLDDASWNAELMRNFRARAERLERRRDDIVARHLDLLNRHYSTTPAERRGELLVSMLSDDLTRVNRLGLELASRTLLNAQPLGPDVARAASLLLVSDDEDVRESAARLLGNLGGAEHADAVARALERERSARVAAPLLLVASRVAISPAPEASIARWLAGDDAAASAAFDAVFAYRDSISEETSRLALDAARAVPVVSLTPSQARVLGALSTDARDLDTLERALREHPSPSVRAVAARSLASDPARVDALLDAARTLPEAFEPACEAVATHRPTPSAFVALASFAPSDASSAQRLAATLAPYTPDRRIAALRAVQDLSRRDAIIAALLARRDAEDEGAIRDLYALLASTRLDAFNAEGALSAALRALRDDEDDEGEVSALRFHALVMMNRLDEASALRLGEAAGAWLDALERLAALEHARDIAARIEQRFGATMSDSERARLSRLAATLPPSDAGAETGASRLSDRRDPSPAGEQNPL